MQWVRWQAALWVTLVFLLPVIGPERLHAASSAGAAGQPEITAPQGQDPLGTDDGAPEPLPPAEHKGVIQPPDIGDEGIHTEVPDPEAGHAKEVIPPSELPEQMPDTKAR